MLIGVQLRKFSFPIDTYLYRNDRHFIYYYIITITFNAFRSKACFFSDFFLNPRSGSHIHTEFRDL